MSLVETIRLAALVLAERHECDHGRPHDVAISHRRILLSVRLTILTE